MLYHFLGILQLQRDIPKPRSLRLQKKDLSIVYYWDIEAFLYEHVPDILCNDDWIQNQ